MTAPWPVEGCTGICCYLPNLASGRSRLLVDDQPFFGVTARPSKETADVIYDQVAECLGQDAYRPRALYGRFGIASLATTDDPCSDLATHAALTADPAWTGRVIPTFRPDRYLEAARTGWPDAVARLGEAAQVDTGDYAVFKL